MDTKTTAELGAMSVKDLTLHHATGDVDIAKIRMYQGQVHDIITMKEKAAKKSGPADLAQSVSGLGAGSIVDQVKKLPGNLLDELRAYFKGEK